jgi:hypothetical protein
MSYKNRIKLSTAVRNEEAKGEREKKLNEFQNQLLAGLEVT